MVGSSAVNTIVYGVAPIAKTATTNGTGIDLANYGSNMLTFAFGVCTDGTFALKIQESDDNSTFTDVAAADQIGSLSNVTSSSGGGATQSVGYIGAKRYVRHVFTVTGAPATGCVVAAWATLGRPHKA